MGSTRPEEICFEQTHATRSEMDARHGGLSFGFGKECSKCKWGSFDSSTWVAVGRMGKKHFLYLLLYARNGYKRERCSYTFGN